MSNEGAGERSGAGAVGASALLEKAIAIAVRAHAGKKDKAGQPYILHPLRVMLSLETLEERIVAILHDVLEDGSPNIADEARRLLPERLLKALNAVTKKADEKGPENYGRFIERAAADPLARAGQRERLGTRRLVAAAALGRRLLVVRPPRGQAGRHPRLFPKGRRLRPAHDRHLRAQRLQYPPPQPRHRRARRERLDYARRRRVEHCRARGRLHHHLAARWDMTATIPAPAASAEFLLDGE